MRKIFFLLFELLSTTIYAQEIAEFAKNLDVAYTCLPNEAPDDLRSAFLGDEIKAKHGMYKLKSKVLYKNIYNQDSYLRYFISYYLFNDTTGCNKAEENFFSKERFDGLRYKVDGPVKTPPLVMIFNSKSIYCLYGSCETELEHWDYLKKSFIKQYAEDNATLMIAACGFVKWETYTK